MLQAEHEAAVLARELDAARAALTRHELVTPGSSRSSPIKLSSPGKQVKAATSSRQVRASLCRVQPEIYVCICASM